MAKQWAEYEVFRERWPSKIDVLNTGDFGLHFHYQTEVLCVCSGEIEVTVNKQTKRLVRGDISVADSYDIHAYRIIEQGSVGRVMIVPKNYLHEYFLATRNMRIDGNFLCQSAAFDIIERLLIMLKEQLEDKNEIFNKGIASAVMSILQQNMSFVPAKNSYKDFHLHDVLKYIYENFDQKIDLKTLSKHFGYTSNHFSALFNSATGYSFREYLANVRLDHAVALLNADSDIISAAYNSGFESVSTFYRLFKSRFDCSPSVFMQKKAEIGNIKK